MRGGTGQPFGRTPAGHGLKLFVPLVLLAAALPAAGQDQDVLSCGVPVRVFLEEGAVHTYRFSMPEGAAVLLQRADVLGTIGLLRLRAYGPGGGGETCSDELTFVSSGGETLLEVSDCLDDPGGDDEGDYTLNLNVVSDDANGCALPLACASTPDGIGLEVPGEVDAYSFSGVEGEQVRLDVTDIDSFGPLRLRVFGPRGVAIDSADDCDHPVQLEVPATGQYTVLVGSCRRPRSGHYRLTFHEPGCPEGPNITSFRIALADGVPLEPNYSELGRPVFERQRGSGMILVLEGRPGANGRDVGIATTGDPLPDMQMLASRTLGDGAPQVCDILPPQIGGVPGVANLDFADSSAVRNAINDLGCRFDDGQGQRQGRTLSLDACTRSDEDFGFGFVDPRTSVQYCAVVDRAWSFPAGDTVVAARLRDESATLGMRREIVLRIAEDETPLPTRTATPTRTRTPTPTRMPTQIVVLGCVGDCDDNGVVEVNELVLAVNVALNLAAVESCAKVDRNGDGSVDVEEILRGVVHSIEGCPPEPEE